jgi:hypothetical protein
MNSGFLSIGLLVYASWQTISFLGDRSPRVWARPRFHRYLPRPTLETLKKNKNCGECVWYRHHPDFARAGTCAHSSWLTIMKSNEVMVKKDAHCELFHRSTSSS